MMRDSFIFYKDWANVIKDLPAEVRLDVYDAVTEYALSGKHHDLKPMAKIAFGFIKQTIDRNAAKYMEVSTKRKEAGKIGAEKRWQKIAKDGKNSNCYVNDNDNVNDNVNDNDILTASIEAEKLPAFITFQKWIKENAPAVGKMPEPFTQDQFISVVSDYGQDVVKDFLIRMDNWRDLKKNKRAYATMLNWIKRAGIKPKTKAKKEMIL